MKYIEYIWLAAAIGLLVLFVTGFQEMEIINMAGILIGTSIAAFMFAFRRRQRILREKAEQEEIERIEKELEDDEDAG